MTVINDYLVNPCTYCAQHNPQNLCHILQREFDSVDPEDFEPGFEGQFYLYCGYFQPKERF